jgi:hypothetical protein
MKKKIVIALLLVSAANCMQSQIQIFGLMRNGSTQGIQLANINPSTGSVTTVSSNVFSNSFIGNAGSAVDPVLKRYYIQSAGKFFGIDLFSGNTVSSPSLTMPFTGYFDMMVYNCHDSTVYGVLRNASTQGIQLAKIDPITGSVSAVSSNAFANGFVWNGWSTIDRANNTYYIQSNGKLWGIDLTSGNTLSSPTVTAAITGYFDMMVFNNSNGTLYGLLRNASTQGLQLATINPATGSVTTISTNTFSSSYVVNGAATIDPINQIYYIQSGGKLWGLDLVSGNPISQPAVSTPSAGYFDMMQINIDCFGAIFGLTTGLSQIDPENSTELYPNPSDGNFNFIIDRDLTNGELSVYNSLGQIVFKQKTYQGNNKVSMDKFPAGIYNYVISEDKTPVKNGRVVIE